MAAMEVYHRGYLISQPYLRDQQGQFSALSTLPSLFSALRPLPLAEASQSVFAVRRDRELSEDGERQRKIKKKMCTTKLHKNVEQGCNESWQSTRGACPQQNSPPTNKRVLVGPSPSLQSRAARCRPSSEANMVHVNGALRVSVRASNQPLSTPHSAYYQCAWLEVMHSPGILSQATVGSSSLGALRGDESHLMTLQDMINVIQNAHLIILLLSHGLIKSQIGLQFH